MTRPERQTRKAPHGARSYVTVGLVALAAIICFYPLTHYFFLQDDFILLEDAAFHPNTAFSAVFDSSPGLFRPLTKVAYFAFMYDAFKLDPVPYHLVSLLLHLVNIFLFFSLLRKFKIDGPSALVVTSLFALSVAFLDVIAWISCVQQLAGMMFMLLGLNLGIRAIDTRSPGFTFAALAAYVLALMSVEQTYALPLVLLLYAYQKEKGDGRSVRVKRAVKSTIPFLVLLGLYLIFMLGWKGIPRGGPYAFHIGTNLGANLLTYLDWVLDLSVVMPFVTNAGSPGLTVSHLLILLLIVYNLARGRQRIVVFGCAYYLLTLLPTLFLEQHAFYIHNYIPSFGIFLMIAPVTQELLGLVAERRPKFAEWFTAGLVVLIAVMCFTKVRTNQSNFLRTDILLPKNFVLRRAVIAKNTYDDIKTKTDMRHPPNQLFMIYKDQSSWYKDNVVAALGKGSALKLFYSDPNLDVFFHNRGDTLQSYNPANSEILFFDHNGRCFTPDEISESGGEAMKIIEPE